MGLIGRLGTAHLKDGRSELRPGYTVQVRWAVT